MLEAVEVITETGVVLWPMSNDGAQSRSNAPDVRNTLIAERFLRDSVPNANESAADNPALTVGKHTVRYAYVKSPGLIFVAVYRSLLHLSWIDKFLDNLATVFVSMYGSQIQQEKNDTHVHCQDFGKLYKQLLLDIEAQEAVKNKQSRVTEVEFPLEDETISGNLGQPPLPPGIMTTKQSAVSENLSSENMPIVTSNTSHPSSSGRTFLDLPKPSAVQRLSRRDRKMQRQAANGLVSSGDEAPKRKTKGKKCSSKGGRKWDIDGAPTYDTGDDDSSVKLDQSDYASEKESTAGSATIESFDASEMGTIDRDGRFVLKDLDDEDVMRSQANKILRAAAKKKAAEKESKNAEEMKSKGFLGAGMNYLTGMFKNVVGSKELSKAELETSIKKLEDHLLKKNVAREAAVRLCEAVEKDLIGTKTATFEGVDTKIRTSLEEVLRKMLTPVNPLDLVHEVDTVTNPPMNSPVAPRPYVISIVGVNGVGKSTNLSKICFFLLQQKKKVLIAAADTFRSGAVEQLGVHVNRLRYEAERTGGQVDLYQKGYGKDAAVVARDAVRHAAEHSYDVVLIDTAGRRHNDERLMGSLEKFAKFARPDKILMVGEALVGSDSVAQARNFNKAFGKDRSLDGFIISKCDTVGDMVGALVSIVHATAVPILFVGIGQHYPDIRAFNVRWAVDKLLSAPDS